MSLVLQHKVVSALPPELEADSIYYVRVGTGFEVYVTNSVGTVIAYPANYCVLPISESTTVSTPTGTPNQLREVAALPVKNVWTPSADGQSIVPTVFVETDIDTTGHSTLSGSRSVGVLHHVTATGGQTHHTHKSQEHKLTVTGGTAIEEYVAQSHVLEPSVAAGGTADGSVGSYVLEELPDLSATVDYVDSFVRRYLDPRLVTQYAGGTVRTPLTLTAGRALTNADSDKDIYVNSSTAVTFTVPPTLLNGWRSRFIQLGAGTIQFSFDPAFTTISSTDDLITSQGIGLGIELTVTPQSGFAKLAAEVERQPTSLVDIRSLGCKINDQTAAASNSTIIQTALAAGIPLLFPVGNTFVDYIQLPSRATMIGYGKTVSRVRWAASNRTTLGNMFQATMDINSLVIKNIGFIGSLQFQTTTTVTGQDLMCMDLRGFSTSNVDIDNISISYFGDGEYAGGGILIGALSGTNKVLENISIRNSDFKNITNVPGIYLFGGGGYHSKVRNVTIVNNTFTVEVTARQNTIFLLGGETLQLTGVDIRGNLFHVSQTMDVLVELNYVNGFSVTDNQIFGLGSGDFTGILLRENTENGTVANNVFSNLGTGNVSSTGISLVWHTSAGYQRNISVVGNKFHKWAAGGFGMAINVSAGSSNILVADNQIMGTSSTVRTGIGIQLASIDGVCVKNNVFENVTYSVTVGTATNCTIENNEFRAVGDGAVATIAQISEGVTIERFVIRNNRVTSIVAGTWAFVSFAPTLLAGSRVENNILPAGWNHVNPSLVASWEAIITPTAATPTTPFVVNQAEVEACYSGALGAAAIRAFPNGGFAMRAGDGALFPALSTTVVAAPRDPTFNGSVDGSVFVSNTTYSAVTSSGTAAGISTGGAQITLNTGSTATGRTRIDYSSRDMANIPFTFSKLASSTAEFFVTIPTLSNATQTFNFSVGAGLVSAGGAGSAVCRIGVSHSTASSGAWVAAAYTAEGTVAASAVGSAPTANVEYKIVIEHAAPWQTATVTITNLSTSAVQTLTINLPSAVTISAPVFPRSWVSLTKTVGTTASTAIVRRARHKVLTT